MDRGADPARRQDRFLWRVDQQRQAATAGHLGGCLRSRHSSITERQDTMKPELDVPTVTQRNKQLMQAIFGELAQGNGRPFRDAMADDFCWKIAGQATWSGEWKGKQAVLQDLLKPLYERFET